MFLPVKTTYLTDIQVEYVVGVLGVTHLLSCVAFSYAGYPRPLQEGYGAYSPLHPAGQSSQPRPWRPQPPRHHSLPREVPFLSVARTLALQLTLSQPCMVDGVSSDQRPGSHPPAHQPKQPTNPTPINPAGRSGKIVLGNKSE